MDELAVVDGHNSRSPSPSTSAVGPIVERVVFRLTGGATPFCIPRKIEKVPVVSSYAVRS